MAAVETRNRLRKPRAVSPTAAVQRGDPFSRMPRFFGRSTAPRAQRAGLAATATAARIEPEQAGLVLSAGASAYEALLHSSSSRSTTAGGDGDTDSHGNSALPPPAPPAPRDVYVRHHGRSLSQHGLQRAWLAAAEARRPSWSGERPPARKLVKDPSGSARPSFAMGIGDGDDDDDQQQQSKGRGRSTSAASAAGLRQKMARWKEAALGERMR